MSLQPPRTRGLAPLRLVVHQHRIIVADDDDDMRSVLVEALGRDGYDVADAPDGEALLARLRNDNEPFDLIITDVRMPVFGGLDLVEALRAGDDQTPVILMTAFPDDLTRHRASRLGALLFDKPFELEDLRKTVAKLLVAEKTN